MKRRTLLLGIAGMPWRSHAAPEPHPPHNLLVRERGVAVVAASSSYGGSEADNLVPSLQRLAEPGVTLQDFIWCTEDNAPFPHWALLDLQRPQWITTLVFNNALKDEPAYPGISARGVEVWLGRESRDRLQRVASFELERGRAHQAVRIEPTEARWLKFVVTSNWGHPAWTEMNPAAAHDDGSRPADLAQALDRQGHVDVYGLYFDFARASLRPESEAVLAQILAWHRAHPQVRLRIEGHTDAIGAASANDALSLARAQAVVSALVARGARTDALQAIGHGARQPVAPNDSDSARARNRRVSVVRADAPSRQP
ncbi:MAG: OmpA family protein [Hydrogenophaga sp.]|uniref:OmpA family protein n=1 Tax=Hydrogenophaga sp. TaxID=1904254 RepID=UPI001D60A5C8|nr:OmpA family protein [Hydrogenophaga sp.]MBX3611618.1 OmpA family protein [Hydrogenophaga sp.]